MIRTSYDAGQVPCAVTVTVRWWAALFGYYAFFVGAVVLVVRHSISVGIRAALPGFLASIVGAFVALIGHAVFVVIGASVGGQGAVFIWTGIRDIWSAI